MIWVIIVFSAYFAMLIAIAVAGMRRMRDMSEYVLGGRRLSSITAALSAGSSTTSAWTMLALPALAFTNGAVEIWVPVAIVAGVWLSWTFIAGRLRRYTIAAGDVLTIPEFLEIRFGDHTGVLRTSAALITILFVVFYVSSGLVGGAKLLETIFGLQYATGVILTLLAIASYTLIGGFMAVSRTDVTQALLMLISLLIMVVFLTIWMDNPLVHIGSYSSSWLNPFNTAEGSPVTLVAILSMAGWAVGGLGAQRILQRFMALQRDDQVAKSRRLSVAWISAVFLLAVLLGVVARPALADIGMLGQATDPERVYLVMSEVFFHPVVTGVLLTAVIAAVMSTADSQLLLASAVATDDLPIIKDVTYRVSGNARVWLGRLLLVVIGIASALVSIYYPGSISNLVSFAWGGMGAAFGPVTLFALYWRRFNAWGAAASIVAGTVAASTWALLDGGPSGIWDIQPATPGFGIASVAAIVVTGLTPQPLAHVVRLFDRVNSGQTDTSPSRSRRRRPRSYLAPRATCTIRFSRASAISVASSVRSCSPITPTNATPRSLPTRKSITVEDNNPAGPPCKTRSPTDSS